MRFAHFEPVLQEAKYRPQSLLPIYDLPYGLLGFRVNVLPDEDFRDWFSSNNRIHQIRPGLVAPNAPALELGL
jgi:hypothetical protein